MFRITYNMTYWGDRDEDTISLVTCEKKSISSASNLLYRVLASIGKDLIAFEMKTGGEWMPYSLDGIESDEQVTLRAAIVDRLQQISDFHQAFYEGIS